MCLFLQAREGVSQPHLQAACVPPGTWALGLDPITCHVWIENGDEVCCALFGTVHGAYHRVFVCSVTRMLACADQA
jgi:hypothetical protein